MFASPTITTRAFEVTDTQRLEEISLGIVAAQVRYLRARGFENLHLQIDSDDLNGMALIKALPVTPQPAFVTYLRPLELTRTG